MKIEQRIYNGSRAKEVLENEAFQAAFSDLKKEITEQWTTSPARDAEGREKLWSLLKIAEKFELILQTTMETGKLAELELKHQQSMADRAREFLGMS